MKVRVGWETRQDELLQGSKTVSEFERDVDTVEEAFSFGYTVAKIHAALFAGLAAANAEDDGQQENTNE